MTSCRHLVKDRLELSGMRWTQDGAENLLHLRAVAENEDWDAYHDFRKHQRHVCLYNIPFPSQASPETQSLDLTFSPALHRNHHQAAAQARHELPLAA